MSETPVLLEGGPAETGGATQPDDGTTRRNLPAVVFDSPPVIDGDLSDPVWETAPRADRFIDQFTGKAAPDQTVVRLGYDDKNIYVSFYAYDSQPQGIVARETKRGTRFQGEDIVAVAFDPFHTHKFADRNFFIVNPLGTQFGHLAAGRATKLEWEGEWKAAAKIVQDGWTAELAIPWKILNYPLVKGASVSGLNFDRFQQRTNIHSWWSNVGVEEKNELDGHWNGVIFPPYRPTLSFLPYSSTGWRKGQGFGQHTGSDLRYTLTPSMTLVGTINPDLENVVGAVEGIDFSYGERFVPDFRPFFQEGSEIFGIGGVAGRFFHSRRIQELDTGFKLYGKAGPKNTVGVLATADLGDQYDWVLRGRHELGETSGLDAALINRDGNGNGNRVMVAGQNYRKGNWSVNSVWAGSLVEEKMTGSTANASLGWRTPRWYAEVVPHYVSPRFRDDLGFIPFTDYRGVNASTGYSTDFRSGPFKYFYAGLDATSSRHYNGAIFRRDLGFNVGLGTRSDYGVDLGWTGGRFEEYNDHAYHLSLRANASDPFHTFGLFYSWGDTAGENRSYLAPFVTWRFWDRMTLGLTSSFLQHKEDRFQHIFTFNYDLSPERSIGGRVIAQTGGTNGYLAFRHSGYGGVERFLIFGDPNAQKFTPRFVAKVVWPM